jgi:hypothetical protein
MRDRATELSLIDRVVRESSAPTQRNRDILDVCEICEAQRHAGPRRNVTGDLSDVPAPARPRQGEVAAVAEADCKGEGRMKGISCNEGDRLNLQARIVTSRPAAP